MRLLKKIVFCLIETLKFIHFEKYDQENIQHL